MKNTKTDFKADITIETANRSFYGVSFSPEKRGERARDDYAATLAQDYADLQQQAAKGGTLEVLNVEFDRYRDGYRKRYSAYLASNARCVSWFIAGPSNFPAARMNKRSDIAARRLNELFEFRSRALAAIKRKLRPDLAPIYASDGDAIDRLQAKIDKAEALQVRMKEANAAIRKNAKTGQSAQIAALLALGYQMGIARELLKPDFCGRIGYPAYELTNNNANIRRMKERIEQITRLQSKPAQEMAGSNARFEDVPAENRVRLWFDGKPAESVRDDLKRHGFRWTPSLGCWQGYRTALDAGKRIAGVGQTPPTGWHKAATKARDAEAMYHALVDDNSRRKARGLPTFEPSYELAIAAIRA